MMQAVLAERSARAQRANYLHRNLTDAELDDLGAVLAAAEQLLVGEHLPALDELADFESATGALNRTFATVAAALGGAAGALRSVTSGASLNQLLLDVSRADSMVRAAQTRARERALALTAEALGGLQNVTSTQRIVELGAEAICKLGFDRSIVSRVDDASWTAASVHITGDSEWAREIVEAGSRPQPIVHGLPEHELVRRQRPILVTRVQERDGVHRAIADASLSRSYVAAPVVPRSEVIGFLHADRFFDRSEVTQFDRDLLSVFAQGFSFALERAMMLEQVEALRSQLGLLTGRLDTALAGPGSWPAVGGAQPREHVSSAPVLSMYEDHEDNRLTRREVEVLKLMAAGDTNARIARRLIISEGTVKSHVKHILRKLGAANRAEAVSRWHSDQTQRSH